MTIRTILTLLLVALAVGPQQAAAQPRELPFKAVTLAGRAEVYQAVAGAWKPASLRAELGPGDGARTLAGARLTLRTTSGQAVRLASLSRVSVLEDGVGGDEPTRVRLDAGAAWVAVMQGGPARESLEVRTSATTVTVRGSGVGITVGPDGSVRVRVYHGTAECASPGGERRWTRPLGADQELTVLAAGAPGVKTFARDKVDADWVKWNEEQDLAGGYGGKPPER
jgi:hypothetical protein